MAVATAAMLTQLTAKQLLKRRRLARQLHQSTRLLQREGAVDGGAEEKVLLHTQCSALSSDSEQELRSCAGALADAERAEACAANPAGFLAQLVTGEARESANLVLQPITRYLLPTRLCRLLAH